MVETQEDRNAEDIKELETKIERVEGVPDRMTTLEKQIEKLNATIEKFIDELRRDYMTKEQCHLCRQNTEDKMDNLKHETTSLRRTVYATIFGVGSFAFGLLVNILMKKFGL